MVSVTSPGKSISTNTIEAYKSIHAWIAALILHDSLCSIDCASVLCHTLPLHKAQTDKCNSFLLSRSNTVDTPNIVSSYRLLSVVTDWILLTGLDLAPLTHRTS